MHERADQNLVFSCHTDSLESWLSDTKWWTAIRKAIASTLHELCSGIKENKIL